MELLLENGADISAVPLAEVLLGWDPRIIRFFLDHRADPITGSPFAVAFGSNCLAPVIECRQTHPELAPALNEQADRALRHFCDTGDMKWISLLMWAGADPRPLGPSLEKEYADEPESYTSGLKEACYAGRVEVLTNLKPKADLDDLNSLLHCAARFG